MTKKKFKISALEIFTIFLPLSALIGAFLLVFGFFISPSSFSQAEMLKANITDGKFDFDEKIAIFNNQPVGSLNEPLPESLSFQDKQRVLSALDEEVKEEKWIEIDLAKQRLYAHQGNRIIYDFLISSGKWGRTPTGDFRVWSKLKYTLMSGGSQALNTYYYLPNVPFTQYFHGGYGIHGTYWHNNFGHPMSHGCINMYTPDAETLFNWTNPPLPLDKWVAYPNRDFPGTRVVVHGKAPLE